ncbi:sensor domain-containing protein [Halovulum marinum]|nr:EAL domain-containing protein [Halovulum marinum]
MTLDALFAHVADRSREAIAVAKADPADGAVMHFVWCNPAFTRLTGFSRSELAGCRASVLAGPDVDQGEHLKIIEKLMNWEYFSVELRNNSKDGRTLWQRMTWAPIQLGDEGGSWWICYIADVSREKSAEQMLNAAPRVPGPAPPQLASVDHIHHGYALFDAGLGLAAANGAFFDALGVDPGAAPVGVAFGALLRTALKADVFAAGEHADSTWIEARVARLRQLAKPYDIAMRDGRVLQIHHGTGPDGLLSLLAIDATEERERQRTLSRSAETAQRSARELEEQNTALREAKELVEKAALTDPLTGLANRRHLSQVLTQRLREMRLRDRPFAALLIDLDRFKLVNDTLGHGAGDELLVHVAQILRAQTRGGDFVARMGGDEFAILTDLTRSAVDVSRMADGILEGASAPFRWRGHAINFGASIGVALATAGMDEPDRIIASADMALYRAKAAGRGRWSFFTEDMHRSALRTQHTATELLRACERDEFVVHYQPQVDARSHALTGVEALVRWNHPQRGILMPDQFLDVADGLGVVKEIDRIVFRHVARDMLDWQARGLDMPKVAVNVSSKRLHDPALVHDISASGVDPARFCIEILESIYLDDTNDVVRWTCDQLSEMGTKIAIDDFGTGHASIQGLLSLAPDILKIDRTFIAPILDEMTKATLAHAIVQIGRCLDIEVIAEGVETLEHARRAAELGCDILQGYAFGRPLDAQALLRHVTGTGAADALSPG